MLEDSISISSITRSYQFPTNQDITGFPKTNGVLGQPSETLWLTEANRIVGTITVYWTPYVSTPVVKNALIYNLQLKTSQQGDINLNPTNLSGINNLQTSSFTLPSNSAFLGWNIQAPLNLWALQPVFVSFQQATWDGPSEGANLE